MPNISSVEDDVAYLKGMAKAGHAAAPRGAKYFLIWGTLIGAALFAQYEIITGQLAIPNWQIWVGAIGSGWVLSIVFGAIDARQPAAAIFANRISSVVWMGTGFALTAFWTGASIFGTVPLAAMMPLSSVMTGTAVLIVGYVFRLRWMYIFAVLWWVIGVASFYFLDRIEFLLWSAAAIFFLHGGLGLMLMAQARSRSA